MLVTDSLQTGIMCCRCWSNEAREQHGACSPNFSFLLRFYIKNNIDVNFRPHVRSWRVL